jgi:hypothetical protein
MNVHNQKVSCPDEGLSWPETYRRALIKLNYNKMHLVGFMRYNFITMGGIYIVKKHQYYFRLFTYQMAYMDIIL